MAIKLTKEIFIERATKKHESKYDYSLVKYINILTKIKIKCLKEGHGEFEQLPNDHLKGSGCPKCAGKEQSNTQEFIKKATTKHNNLYDYSLVKYINNSTKVLITCPIYGHGIFEQRPNDHLKGTGCPKCGGTKKLTQEEFIKKAEAIHNNLYDYSSVNYINSRTKITIICPVHDEFEQLPNDHLNGSGCPNCSGFNKSTNIFIQEAIMVHGNKYNYSLVNYVDAKTKITIICPVHDEFEQSPNGHLNGQGCQKCAGTHQPTTKEFIKKAEAIHNNLYDYSLVDYNGAFNKIKIICRCREHGEFEQQPHDHLKGRGCPKCCHRISKPESSWLDSLNILPENRQIKILNFKVDGYDPVTNTIYEFNGDFWHGNPEIFKPQDINPINKKTYGYLYEQTLMKEQTLKSNGYNVVSIWENDWLT